MKVQWQEPVEFCRAFVQAQGHAPTRRGVVLSGVVAAGTVALLTYAFQLFFQVVHKKDLGVPMYFYLVAPTVAGVFVGFLPYMLSVIPATIVLTEKGIFRNKPIGSELSIQFWPWDSITELAVEDVQYAEQLHRVLVVRSQAEPADVLLGLGSAPLDRIHEFASQMGKTLVNRLPQSDENS